MSGEDLVQGFVDWVATHRAYNGSEHPHGQSLYNECLNEVLPEWGREFMAEQPIAEDAPKYAFTFDVIASDREGYYIDRWDRSHRFEVIGKTKEHALEVLRPLVGEVPRGRFWKARQVGTATDVRLRQPLVEEKKEEV